MKGTTEHRQIVRLSRLDHVKQQGNRTDFDVLGQIRQVRVGESDLQPLAPPEHLPRGGQGHERLRTELAQPVSVDIDRPLAPKPAHVGDRVDVNMRRRIKATSNLRERQPVP